MDKRLRAALLVAALSLTSVACGGTGGVEEELEEGAGEIQQELEEAGES